MKLLFSSLFLLFALSSFAQEYGEAAYYADKLQGRSTASGEPYDMNKMTAAHRTYPFGTMIKVTNIDNNRSVVVRVNDRGPFTEGRVVDVSRKAAEQLDLIRSGVARVKLEVTSEEKAVGSSMTAKGVSRNQAKTATPKTYSDNSIPRKATTKTPIKVSTPKAESSDATKVEQKKASSDFVGYGVYKVETLSPKSSAFSVQVASFSTYENAVQQVSVYQKKWFKDVYINVEQGKDGLPDYKVILGQFEDKAAAENYKKNLKRKHNISGFVVDLSAQ